MPEKHKPNVYSISHRSKISTVFILVLMAALPASQTLLAQSPAVPMTKYEKLPEDILRQLVEFESTGEKPEQTRMALEAMAMRLRNAGIPEEDVILVNPYEGGYGLVARYRGIATQGPLLTMAHIDVVTADPDAWAFPPFSFGSKEGYYFGRGTQDNKTGVAHLVSNFIRLKDENYVPNRDLIMALTGDEETEMKVIEWMASEGRELIDADYALNTDGGGGELGDDGKPAAFWIQTSEKLYQTYRISATNPGGHSSLPRPDNAITQLSRALVRIGDYQFPIELAVDTTLMLERTASRVDNETAEDILAVTRNGDSLAAQRVARDPARNALMRTTCVATQLKGGHAENALPRNASATINCRILPGTDPAEIEAGLQTIVNDPGIVFETIYESVPSPPSSLPDALLETLEALVEESWPGIPVIPQMSTGATDGLYVRNAGIPVYGVAGWFLHPGEVRAHGLDEKISIQRFHEGTEFWYRMLKELSH